LAAFLQFKRVVKAIKPITLSLFVAMTLASTARAEKYGLANMLSAAPAVANSIRPSESAGLAEQELNSYSRHQPKPESVSVARPQAAAAPVAIDWHEVVQSALRASATASVSKSAPAAEQRKDAVLDEPAVRPFNAQSRLLSSVSSKKPSIAVAQERIAPVVSDLGVFRARSLASDTSLPASFSAGVPHSTQLGRSNPTPSAHSQGFTQSE
jgi:hypothetical protein